MPIACT